MTRQEVERCSFLETPGWSEGHMTTWSLSRTGELGLLLPPVVGWAHFQDDVIVPD